EAAGADRCVLLLLQEDALTVQAMMDATHGQLVRGCQNSDGDRAQVPRSVVDYVFRTREVLLVREASTDSRFADDACLRVRRPRSVMCAPLENQGQLVGVLYLENRMASGAFTPARVQMLQMLSVQAAISLENARLFETTRQLNISLEAEVRAVWTAEAE